jgi:hypothetical protein
MPEHLKKIAMRRSKRRKNPTLSQVVGSRVASMSLSKMDVWLDS